MAVEKDGGSRAQVLQHRQAGTELVDKEVVGFEFVQLASDPDLEEEEQLARNGTNDHEARENRRWEGIAANAHIEGS